MLSRSSFLNSSSSLLTFCSSFTFFAVSANRKVFSDSDAFFASPRTVTMMEVLELPEMESSIINVSFESRKEIGAFASFARSDNPRMQVANAFRLVLIVFASCGPTRRRRAVVEQAAAAAPQLQAHHGFAGSRQQLGVGGRGRRVGRELWVRAWRAECVDGAATRAVEAANRAVQAAPNAEAAVRDYFAARKQLRLLAVSVALPKRRAPVALPTARPRAARKLGQSGLLRPTQSDWRHFYCLLIRPSPWP